MKHLFISIALLFSFSQNSFAARAKIQNEDIKSAAEIMAAGGTISSLINDDKIYIKANGLNIPLKNAIEAGVLNTAGPAGAILAFAGPVCPAGYLPADGASYLRSTYPNLFTAIGTFHGFSSGTTFNVPDYRGRFLRGVTGLVLNDPDNALRQAANTGGSTGNNVGSVQGHAFQSHSHVQNAHQHVTPLAPSLYNSVAPWNPGLFNATYANNNFQFGAGGSILNFPSGSAAAQSGYFTTLATATNQTTGASGPLGAASVNESRPVNAYVTYCIKF